MKFGTLPADFEASIQNIGDIKTDIEITSLTSDSRQVVPGSCFIAQKGVDVDGHKYIAKAIKAGAIALIVEDISLVPDAFPVAVFSNTKLVSGFLFSKFFNEPSSKLFIAGITGTNGKTSTTYICEAMLKHCGLTVGVIGTINYRYKDKEFKATTTTPGAEELQALIEQMVNDGVTHLLMEVSSHALDQHRVDGTMFDCTVFSNLSRDHLDYHHSIKDYAKAKQRLNCELLESSSKQNRIAAIMIDDEYAEFMVRGLSSKVVRLSSQNNKDADIYAKNINVTLDGSTLELMAFGKAIKIKTPLIGFHNAKNIIQALAIAYACGLDLTQAATGIESCKNIPGRLERVNDKMGIHVFVDYSHTPDALQNVLSVLNKLKTGRLITVFGCGGDRDKGKRPLMGEVAARFCDIAVITSDNPRGEDADAILLDIEPGVIKCGMKKTASQDKPVSNGFYAIIENRARAIIFAVNNAKRGDIILIAGKGHEDYQIIGNTKHDFDDREQAQKALDAKYIAGGKI